MNENTYQFKVYRLAGVDSIISVFGLFRNCSVIFSLWQFVIPIPAFGAEEFEALNITINYLLLQ